MREKIILSLSGGLSSGMLGYDLYTTGFDVIYIFANTGLENNETLDFINRMEKEWGIEVVWLEAVVNPDHGKGITHRVTNYKDAFRANQYKHSGHPYHAFVRKSGIPNQTYKQCSDRLKQLVIEDYKKNNGLSGVKHALGMRFDEPNRVCSSSVRKAIRKTGFDDFDFRNKFRESNLEKLKIMISLGKINLDDSDLKLIQSYVKKISKYNLCYPLYDMYEKDKQDVNEFWSNQPFGLELEDHEGNCQTCWKKSDKKLWLLAVEHPERFEAFAWFEQQYKNVKKNRDGTQRLFFRKHRSVEMIIGESKLYDAYTLRKMIGANPEIDAGCTESCEAYSD